MTDPGIHTDEVPVSLNLTRYQKVFDRPSWHRMGACHDKPGDWWFSNQPTEILAAKLLCTQLCPVRYRCLAENLDVPYGMFGGLTADERKVIRDEYPVVVSVYILQLLMEDKDTR